MDFIFKSFDKFFASLNSYIGLGDSFMIFVGLFLVAIVGVFISTMTSYEAKLIRAIDMLNGYFVNNPKITEDNLVLFNQIMRHNKVPKLLRKYWQQFMLYRDNNASYYMSFENCVTIPLRNSKFKRDKKMLNMFAYILAGGALILNTYLAPETTDVAYVLQRILLAPVIILLLNYIFTIVLDLKESAIINDLNQNYQYFETNIDKATKTLPDYVDYEILFDRAEIKKGIPVLYQYLQKRAEDEQRELELARLKNVEHEKFNFDEAGLAGSLVLERAMQEAENYIAERKKYGQDIAQINSEMAQEDNRYREKTKEYNRQMQVSKETFANIKKDLEEATSSIQANYLKKQQQQELDRQRNLERDFDTETDKHKNVIENFQAELDSIDKFIAASRKSLEDAMMAEFDTYSGKVYDEAKKVIEERQKEKFDKIKQEVKDLEEKLYEKTKGADESEDFENNNLEDNQKQEFNFDNLEEQPATENNTLSENENLNNIQEPVWENETQEDKFEDSEDDDKDSGEPLNVKPEFENTDNAWNFDNNSNDLGFENSNSNEETNNEGFQSYRDFLKEQGYDEFKLDEQETSTASNSEFDNNNYFNNSNEDEKTDEEFKSIVQRDESDKQGENVKQESENDEGEENFAWLDRLLSDDEESKDEQKPVETGAVDTRVATMQDERPVEPKRKAGRPRKVVDESEAQAPKRKPGRPRKETVSTKTATETKKRGRPRKVVDKSETQEPKRKPGRPRKEVQTVEQGVKRKPGRPKKVSIENIDENADLDAYLKVIDSAIAKENAKIKESQKALENHANIKPKNKK